MEETVQTENALPNYEFNSYYSRDISTDTWFNIFDDYSVEQISEIIKNPMVNNEQLRQISRRLYSSNGLTRNTIDYMTSMPTLDYVITTYQKDQKSKLQKEMVQFVLDKIKHKEIIRDAIHKGAIDGTCFYYFDTGDRPINKSKSMSWFDAESIMEINALKQKLSDINASIISLPTDYCRIVGIKNNSYVIAFDLEYFTKSNNNENIENKLRKYPKEIRDGYNKWKNGQGKQMLVLDNTRTIVHKISSNKDEPWGRPLVLAAILDILYSDYFTKTKRKILDDVNNQIIYETFPQGKEAGTSALTSKQQKEQHDAVKQGVTSKNNRGGISFFSVAAGTKIDQIKADVSLLDEKNSSYIQDQIGIDLGFMANILSGSGSGNYAAQQNNLQLLLSEVLMWIEPITEELVKVVNENIINDKNNTVGLYYLPCSYITRADFTNQMKDLYLQGKGSLRAWIASTGFNSEAYIELMNMELEEGFDEKYQPHPTSFTISSNDTENDKGGRPENENPTSSSTITSKSNNANDMPSPSDNK